MECFCYDWACHAGSKVFKRRLVYNVTVRISPLYTHTHAHMRARAHAHTHTHTHTHTNKHTRTNTSARVHTHTHTHTHLVDKSNFKKPSICIKSNQQLVIRLANMTVNKLASYIDIQITQSHFISST